MTTITARYDGPGALQEHDPASDAPQLVPTGGTFGTTKTRLAQLVEQGIAVVQVDDKAPTKTTAPDPATTEARGAQENV